MKKTNLKVSLFLSFLCFIAGFFVFTYQMEILQNELPNQYKETMPLPFGVMLILIALQLFVISFILAFLGIKLARRTGFSLNLLDSMFNKGKVNFDKKATLLSIVIGMFLALIILGADRYYYQYQIPLIGEDTPEFSILGLLAGILYGGVFEEILLRLFFMSLLIWIFLKVFKRTIENLSSKFYWIAIFISSALFAAGHLPATEMFFGELTTILIVRSFLLNGIGGLFFGYLYWKKGLEYAILSHMFCHISLQLIFIPLFY